MQAQNGLQGFRLPRYRELPNFGLYLDQTVTFVNRAVAPLEIPPLTTSMLSNYVKHGYINRPVRKQYFADQIGYLIFLTITKQALSLEHISALFDMQRRTYSSEDAYDNFCLRFESMLDYLFDACGEPVLYGEDATFEQQVLQSVIVATTHIIYLNWCLENAPDNTPA